MEQWYTLHTKFNAEHQIASLLQQKGIETFLPQIRSLESDRLEPLFPCYLFTRVDLEITSYDQLNWTPGLRRFVAFDEEPFVIPNEVIIHLQQSLRIVEKPQHPALYGLEPGDAVEIIDGPFAGLQAIFDGPMTASQRVSVLLQVLGSANRVHVAVTDIKKATINVNPEKTKRPRRTRGHGRRIHNKT